MHLLFLVDDISRAHKVLAFLSSNPLQLSFLLLYLPRTLEIWGDPGRCREVWGDINGTCSALLNGLCRYEGSGIRDCAGTSLETGAAVESNPGWFGRSGMCVRF